MAAQDATRRWQHTHDCDQARSVLKQQVVWSQGPRPRHVT